MLECCGATAATQSFVFDAESEVRVVSNCTPGSTFEAVGVDDGASRGEDYTEMKSIAEYIHCCVLARRKRLVTPRLLRGAVL
jgi:hypothetical protein